MVSARRKLSREIKAKAKEPQLQDDGTMGAVVGKEKRGNTQLCARKSRGRPVGFRLGQRQLELQAG